MVNLRTPARFALLIALALAGPSGTRPCFAQDLNEQARQYEAHDAAGRYREAAEVAARGLKIARAGQKTAEIADWADGLGVSYVKSGQFHKAETLLKEALSLREKFLGTDDPRIAAGLNNLAVLYKSQGRYAEAEPLYRRALAIREKALGADHPDTAAGLNNLASLYQSRGRYAEAEPLYRRSLAIREKALGADHPDTATGLNNLAALYQAQGRYAEAEPLYRRSLAIREKALGADHPDTATGLNNLAVLYESQGRYAEAEPLYQRSLAIREKALGADHPDTAQSLDNLAGLYYAQGRYAEAEPLFKRSQAIQEKALGADHSDTAAGLNNLASLYESLGRYAEAEPLFRRALAIREKALGADHPSTATSLNSLAILYKSQGRYAEAEPLYKRSLAIREKALGADHPDTAVGLNNLASLYESLGRYAEAEPLIDRAITIRDRAGVAPGVRSGSYHLRAILSWKLDRREDAVDDLRHALDLAEQQRGHASGAERERAEAFESFARAFERMVDWQTELGSPAEAFAAMERARADRSLLDEIGTAGADLNVGRSLAEREQARQRESEAKAKVAELEARAGKAKGDEKERLQAEAVAARNALYELYRDERSNSPVYRNLLSAGSGPPRLTRLQRRLPEKSRLFAYLFGKDGGYVLCAGPKEARVVRLTVPGAEAKLLGINPGALDLSRLRAALLGAKGEGKGVVAALAAPVPAPDLAPRLAALWRVLVPEAERAALLDGSVTSLRVVPDGPLALLPFEALAVGGDGKAPRYLIDDGPPVSYGPSATVLDNLAARPIIPPRGDRQPVLAVGDPAYPGGDESAPGDALAAVTSRARFRSAGGALARLPSSGLEARWVAEAYKERGIKAGVFTGPAATEAAVRYWSPGRKVLHLACHGLADDRLGNFFGALALTPGPRGSADPADDGFLTLAEVYELDLKGSELVMLSACQTNFGPQQQGEGTWALSRGFLVAGARRVAASNWLVDDEAGASLVGAYAAGLAQAEKDGKAPDHAATLRAAKRSVKGQEKWAAPYYWAGLVLVGPP